MNTASKTLMSSQIIFLEERVSVLEDTLTEKLEQIQRLEKVYKAASLLFGRWDDSPSERSHAEYFGEWDDLDEALQIVERGSME